MKILRAVVTGLVAGAVIGLVAALLRPRRMPSRSGYSPVMDLPDDARHV